MRGRVYCVGVGPGDPELMTLKAKRLTEEKRVIAFPCNSGNPDDSRAYSTARQAVPGLEKKTLLPLRLPMVKDRALLGEYHQKAAEEMRKLLDAGEDIVYLTIGDPSVYCTYSYLGDILKKQGIETVYVSGVPSFCAAAASLGVSIAEGEESFLVMPADRFVPGTDGDRNLVLMKAGGDTAELKKALDAQGYDVCGAADCGMENEVLWRRSEDIPDSTGYFTVMICRR